MIIKLLILLYSSIILKGVLKEKSNISTVTTNQPSKSSTVSQNKMTPKAINKTKPTLGSAAISSELKARCIFFLIK